MKTILKIILSMLIAAVIIALFALIYFAVKSFFIWLFTLLPNINPTCIVGIVTIFVLLTVGFCAITID